MVLAGRGVDEATQCLAQGVIFLGDAISGELWFSGCDVGTFSRLARQDAGRNSHRSCTCRNRFDHHRVAADLGTITHFKSAQYFGTCTHHHIFPQSGVALGAFIERCSTQGHALVNGASVTDFCGLSHHHAHGMVKKDTVADFGSGVNLNTGEKARNVGNKTTQPLKAMDPARMRHSVKDHGM